MMGRLRHSGPGGGGSGRPVQRVATFDAGIGACGGATASCSAACAGERDEALNWGGVTAGLFFGRAAEELKDEIGVQPRLLSCPPRSALRRLLPYPHIDASELLPDWRGSTA